ALGPRPPPRNPRRDQPRSHRATERVDPRLAEEAEDLLPVHPRIVLDPLVRTGIEERDRPQLLRQSQADGADLEMSASIVTVDDEEDVENIRIIEFELFKVVAPEGCSLMLEDGNAAQKLDDLALRTLRHALRKLGPASALDKSPLRGQDQDVVVAHGRILPRVGLSRSPVFGLRSSAFGFFVECCPE